MAFLLQMLEACKAIRAHQLPDPAEGRPEFPLSDVAIIAYTDHDRKQAARTGSKTWSDPEEGMLDVVEARLKGLNVPKRKFLYNKRTLMQVTGLQDRLNRYLHAARLWSSEKLAKVRIWRQAQGSFQAELWLGALPSSSAWHAQNCNVAFRACVAS